MLENPPLCPVCSSPGVRPIIYGEPSPDLGEQAERGEIVLGGCVLFGNDPKWDCAGCGNQFGLVAEDP